MFMSGYLDITLSGWNKIYGQPLFSSAGLYLRPAASREIFKLNFSIPVLVSHPSTKEKGVQTVSLNTSMNILDLSMAKASERERKPRTAFPFASTCASLVQH